MYNGSHFLWSFSELVAAHISISASEKFLNRGNREKRVPHRGKVVSSRRFSSMHDDHGAKPMCVTFSVRVTLAWLHSNVKVDRRKFRAALRSLAAYERAQPVHYSKVVRRSHATPPYRRRSRRLILAVFLLLS